MTSGVFNSIRGMVQARGSLQNLSLYFSGKHGRGPWTIGCHDEQSGPHGRRDKGIEMTVRSGEILHMETSRLPVCTRGSHPTHTSRYPALSFPRYT